MTYSKRLRLAPISVALAVTFVFGVATPRPAEAFIDEIIAALCHGSEVIPPGQIKGGRSFTRALLATGFITSVVATSTNVTINFDPTVPNSKFRDAGIGPLVIPDGAGPGVSLTLNPLIEPDPDFPAHRNCPRFPTGP